MSQWQHGRGRWGQGRGLSGRSSAKRKGGKHNPERVLKRILLQKNVFPPWIFFNKIQDQNEELGLIIDLTYTRRSYKPEVPRVSGIYNICPSMSGLFQ
ncbi:RNA/RNP complex-1-interacting phosphatase-like [Balaenoptera acutorostrata]|uniref:RNA/RNP complex-1-interacting phosphatase-like n=1 Tax=Balaenoptera acutorostrata TaxID=9767 RepID=A0ABM3UI70_BALAC|nr:RNA/RNP complex-1-interacting phosphatase-like [Balaenoptera acutorostrata]